MFTCKSCRNYRNDWDAAGQGICVVCTRSGVSKPTQRVVTTQGGFGGPRQQIVSVENNRSAVGKNVQLPCRSCKKFIGPKQGTMMRNGDVFCMECLNTGAYLKVGKTGEYVKRGNQDIYQGKQKPAGRFGR